jgi:hypothetical protein
LWTTLLRFIEFYDGQMGPNWHHEFFNLPFNPK